MSALEVGILALSLQGLLFIALGFAMPGMARSPLVGIRIRATMADERVWRETHARAGPRFSRVGGVILVGGLALVFAPGPDVLRWMLMLALLAGGVGWFVWDTVRYAEARLRHWRAVDSAAHPDEG